MSGRGDVGEGNGVGLVVWQEIGGEGGARPQAEPVLTFIAKNGYPAVVSK